MRVTGLLLVLLTIAAAGCGGSNDANSVDVQGDEYAFVMPDEAKAGVVNFDISNVGEELHEYALGRLSEGKTIDDSYANGDGLFLHVCRPGDIIQVLVKSGQTVVKGNGGAADASGGWIVATVNSVGEFTEGSGGALGADTHMRLRVF